MRQFVIKGNKENDFYSQHFQQLMIFY